MKQLFKTIKVSWIAPNTKLITLNRPSSANAFNSEMATEINNFFGNLALEKNACRAVVITGAGAKAFSAGGDLKERLGMTIESWKNQHLIFEKMIRSIIETSFLC